MSSGIAHLSCIPMRAEPSGKSEMVSQLLMGETYRVLEENADWLKIRMDWDHYEGWISAAQYLDYPGAAITNLITTSPVSYAIGKRTHILSMGSEVHHAPDYYCLRHDPEPVELSAQNPAPSVTELAESMLGVPYLWGGRTFMGIDCSGLVQVVAKARRKAIHRDARDQVQLGETVAFVPEALPGDLAFFDNEDGRIVHVGILLSFDKIIHAHGQVRIDRFDSAGIFNEERRKYSHRLRVIKRVSL